MTRDSANRSPDAGAAWDELSPARNDCTCGRVWEGHPNPHAITCPLHVVIPPG